MSLSFCLFGTLIHYKCYYNNFFLYQFLKYDQTKLSRKNVNKEGVWEVETIIPKSARVRSHEFYAIVIQVRGLASYKTRLNPPFST